MSEKMREHVDENQEPGRHAEQPCDEVLAHDAVLLI
jgi:hypothetical protein